jgi:hypothetical protein
MYLYSCSSLQSKQDDDHGWYDDLFVYFVTGMGCALNLITAFVAKARFLVCCPTSSILTTSIPAWIDVVHSLNLLCLLISRDTPNPYTHTMDTPTPARKKQSVRVTSPTPRATSAPANLKSFDSAGKVSPFSQSPTILH